MRTNAFLPDWLQTILDVVGDIGLIVAMAKWAYKHSTQLRQLSFVAIFAIAIVGIIMSFPPSISYAPGPVPIGRFTSNLPAYDSANAYYQSWLFGWIAFFGFIVSGGLLVFLDSGESCSVQSVPSDEENRGVERLSARALSPLFCPLRTPGEMLEQNVVTLVCPSMVDPRDRDG